MIVLGTVAEMQRASEQFRSEGKRVAVIPTMGYLHEGHLSLIRIAKQHCDVAITTIFVNPLQFGPQEDYSRYPRNIERDKRLAEEAGTGILFIPPNDEMYPPPRHHTHVTIDALSDVLEGSVRPGHFRGVATVVAKLFNITKPHVAVFGQKDAQQAFLIQTMVRELNFDIEVIIAPIIRDHDGLALSSRNVYLNPEERKQSVVLSQSLRLAEDLISSGERDSAVLLSAMRKHINTQPLAKIDYITITGTATLEDIPVLRQDNIALISLAVRFGSTRLIDNTIVHIHHS